MAKNENIRIALDLTEEWNSVSTDGGSLVTGVVVVRNDFLAENEESFKSFLAEYKESTEYVNANTEAAAKLIEQLDIVAASVAEKALPYCNIVFLTGDDMSLKLKGYLEVLFSMNPASVGGSTPDEEFYYKA